MEQLELIKQVLEMGISLEKSRRHLYKRGGKLGYTILNFNEDADISRERDFQPDEVDTAIKIWIKETNLA